MPVNSVAQDHHSEHTEVTHHDDGHADEGSHEEDSHHPKAPGWSIFPFVLLLAMIATGPIFYEHFWHKNYPKIAIALAAIVVSFYVFALHNVHSPIHALAEYIQFISLLSALYIASGGILINVDKKVTPLANVGLLLIGALISNLIGTTGASMLLIRPFIRLNRHRIQAYHIIFFIFMVSNVGGSLTPIGDPPLFLGFLKGVPFFWTLTNNIIAWAFALGILALIFFYMDSRNKKSEGLEDESEVFTNRVSITGRKNFVWLLIVIIAVFLDPNIIDGVPYILYDGQKISFLREIIMLSVAYLSYRLADKDIIAKNEFSFEPIREVAFIFVGIFGTMMPALELVSEFAKSESGASLISYNTLYWGTGLLSGFLDNAPTYLNFLAAAMASVGLNISTPAEVQNFAAGGFPDSILYLKAISIASVFFGAMSYIGNGPNFMVKSIAEQVGIRMPSFFGYMLRYSIPILLPLLILVWVVFFALL